MAGPPVFVLLEQEDASELDSRPAVGPGTDEVVLYHRPVAAQAGTITVEGTRQRPTVQARRTRQEVIAVLQLANPGSDWSTGDQHARGGSAPLKRPPVRRRVSVPPPEPRSMLLGGRALPYVLVASARARRVRLVVRPGTGLEVVVPLGMPAHGHEQVLRDKERWIFATLERVAREFAAVAPPPLVAGRRLAFAGRELALEILPDGRPGHYRAALSDHALTLTLASDDAEVVRKALELWYRRQAPAVFAERLRIHNRTYGFTYGRVSVKGQKSRWGSCSKLGNLNFNWRLLLAPMVVLDYVVVHELCHLKELNHGPRFWKLVARACPDYAEHRRWLRQHGKELVF